VSDQGIRIETNRHLESYSKIFILVQTGEGESDKFYFDGVVAWSEKSQERNIYGIEITDIDFDSRLHLNTFIQNNT